MKKAELKSFLKLISAYKEYCLSGNGDPFAYHNAYWAAGMEGFLTWATKQKR